MLPILELWDGFGLPADFRRYSFGVSSLVSETRCCFGCNDKRANVEHPPYPSPGNDGKTWISFYRDQWLGDDKNHQFIFLRQIGCLRPRQEVGQKSNFSIHINKFAQFYNPFYLNELEFTERVCTWLHSMQILTPRANEILPRHIVVGHKNENPFN